MVLGQSMGGLVARYALRDIEVNRSFNHDTRLYVSHDAPHLGANTPLSVQLSARHLRNQYISTPIALLAGDVLLPLAYNFAEGFSNIINVFGADTSVPTVITPLRAFSLADVAAARQMQYTWVTNNYQIDNFIHDAWQTEYSQMGYPQGYLGQQIRNISIANGSECGITQIDNGNILSYVKDAGRDTLLSDYIGILDAVYGALLLRPDIVFTALFPGNSYWEIDFQSKYMTILNQNKNIYHGSIKYKKKVFWFIPVSITLFNKNINQPSGVLPYDIYGGGWQAAATSQIPLSGIVSNAFGFVPSASALDIGSSSTTLNDTDYRKSYVGASPPVAPKNTAFQNFVTHFDQFNPNNNNSPHISFNRRNGNWLEAELVDNNIQFTDCSSFCSNTEIIGTDYLCTTRTYSISGGGSTYNWVITSGTGLATMSGNGTNSITLTKNTGGPGGFGASGSLTLSVTATNPDCGSSTITKTIWVGKPSFPQLTTSSGVPYDEFNLPAGCANGVTYWVFKTSNPLDRVTQFQFSVQGGNVITKNASNGLATITAQELGMIEGMTLDVTVRPVNVCGSNFLVPKFKLYRPTDCECGIGINCNLNRVAAPNDRYNLYPNPTSGFINIVPVSSDSGTTSKSKIIATLYDMLGEKRKSVVINNDKTSMDVQDLKAGMYIMKIQIDGEIETHLIVIN